MEGIEYLEEYEDLILPTIQSNNREIGAYTAKKSKNMMQDEDSSSIDQDIFESLFDDHSDDESSNVLQKKADPKLSQRGKDDRASLDSLDMLVKDLVGEQSSQRQSKPPSKSSTNMTTASSSKETIQQQKRMAPSSSGRPVQKGRNFGAASSSKSNTARPSMNYSRKFSTGSSSATSATQSATRYSNPFRQKISSSSGFSTSLSEVGYRRDKSKSVATVRPTVQHGTSAGSSSLRNLAPASTSTPQSRSGGLLTLSARKQMSSVAKRESLRRDSPTSTRSDPSTSRNVPKLSKATAITKPDISSKPIQRSVISTTKTEERNERHTGEDPLSLDDLADALLDSDTDSFSLSESLGSLSDLENPQHIIDISNDSSIDGRGNHKDLENIHRITPSPTVSDVEKEEDSLPPNMDAKSDKPDIIEHDELDSFSNDGRSCLDVFLGDNANDEDLSIKSKKLPAEKVTILSDTLLTRIDTALLDTAVMDKINARNKCSDQTNEDVAIESELQPFLDYTENKDKKPNDATTAIENDASEPPSKCVQHERSEDVFKINEDLAIHNNNNEQDSEKVELEYQLTKELKEIDTNLDELDEGVIDPSKEPQMDESQVYNTGKQEKDEKSFEEDGTLDDYDDLHRTEEFSSETNQKENLDVAIEVEIETVKETTISGEPMDTGAIESDTAAQVESTIVPNVENNGESPIKPSDSDNVDIEEATTKESSELSHSIQKPSSKTDEATSSQANDLSQKESSKKSSHSTNDDNKSKNETTEQKRKCLPDEEKYDDPKKKSKTEAKEKSKLLSMESDRVTNSSESKIETTNQSKIQEVYLTNETTCDNTKNKVDKSPNISADVVKEQKNDANKTRKEELVKDMQSREKNATSKTKKKTGLNLDSISKATTPSTKTITTKDEKTPLIVKANEEENNKDDEMTTKKNEKTVQQKKNCDPKKETRDANKDSSIGTAIDDRKSDVNNAKDSPTRNVTTKQGASGRKERTRVVEHRLCSVKKTTEQRDASIVGELNKKVSTETHNLVDDVTKSARAKHSAEPLRNSETEEVSTREIDDVCETEKDKPKEDPSDDNVQKVVKRDLEKPKVSPQLKSSDDKSKSDENNLPTKAGCKNVTSSDRSDQDEWKAVDRNTTQADQEEDKSFSTVKDTENVIKADAAAKIEDQTISPKLLNTTTTYTAGRKGKRSKAKQNADNTEEKQLKSTPTQSPVRKSLRSKVTEPSPTQKPEKVMHSHGTRNALKSKVASLTDVSKNSTAMAAATQEEQPTAAPLHVTRNAAKGRGAAIKIQLIAAGKDSTELSGVESISLAKKLTETAELPELGGRMMRAATGKKTEDREQKEDNAKGGESSRIENKLQKTKLSPAKKGSKTPNANTFAKHSDNVAAELKAGTVSEVKKKLSLGTTPLEKSKKTTNTNVSLKEWSSTRATIDSKQSSKSRQQLDSMDVPQKSTKESMNSVKTPQQSSLLSPAARKKLNTSKDTIINSDQIKESAMTLKIGKSVETITTAGRHEEDAHTPSSLTTHTTNGENITQISKADPTKKTTTIECAASKSDMVATKKATNAAPTSANNLAKSKTSTSTTTRKRGRTTEVDILLDALPGIIASSPLSNKRRRQEYNSGASTPTTMKPQLDKSATASLNSSASTTEFKTPTAPPKRVATLSSANSTTLKNIDPKKQRSSQKTFPLKMLDISSSGASNPFATVPTSTIDERPEQKRSPPKLKSSLLSQSNHYKCRKVRVRLNRSILRRYCRSVIYTQEKHPTLALKMKFTNSALKSSLSITKRSNILPKNTTLVQDVDASKAPTNASLLATPEISTSSNVMKSLSGNNSAMLLRDAFIAALEAPTGKVLSNSDDKNVTHSLQMGEVSGAEIKPAQISPAVISASTNITSSATLQNDIRGEITPSAHSPSSLGDDSSLLTPLKSGAQAQASNKQPQQQKRSLRLQQHNASKQTIQVQQQLPKASSQHTSLLQQPLQQQQQQKQQPEAEQQQEAMFTPIEPKQEFDDEQTPTTTKTGTGKFPEAGEGGASMFNGGLPTAVVDSNGTRLYTFLHPVKYNRSHGAVLLDYCCPNLEGPMSAIDPTRDHTQVQSLVRELPTYIVMTTKVVTRADLEAKNNTIPESIRKKMEKLNLAVASGSAKNARPDATKPQTASPALTAALGTAAAPSTSATSSSTLYTPTISAFQKQLPATTTLTPKILPPQSTAASASDNPPPLTHFGVTNSQTVNAPAAAGSATISQMPAITQRPEFVRAVLRANLRRFDSLLRKCSGRVGELSFVERQHIVDKLVTKAVYTPNDVELAIRLLNDYSQIVDTGLPFAKTAALTVAQTSVGYTSVANATPKTVVSIGGGSTSCTNTAAIAAQQLEQLHASAVRKVRTAGSANQKQRQVPIYDKDRNIIGYQMQVSSVTLTPSSAASLSMSARAQNMSAQGANSSQQYRLTNQTLPSNGSSTPTLKQPVQDSPRIFYTKPMHTSTPVANSTKNNSGSASSPAITIGRNVTIKQFPVKPSPQDNNNSNRNSMLSQILSQPLKPVPTTSSASRIGNTVTGPDTITTKTNVMLSGSLMLPNLTTKRLTRHTASTKTGQQVVIITTKEKDVVCGTDNNDDECILPDNERVAADNLKEIKREQDDDGFIGAS